MGKTGLAILITIAFSAIGIVGDYFLKLASGRERPLLSGSFYLGLACTRPPPSAGFMSCGI